MLGALSVSAPPQRTLGAVESNGGELRVKGLASSPAEAQPIAAILKSMGYSAVLQGDALVLTQEGTP
jgi:general secretion pathway protein L